MSTRSTAQAILCLGRMSSVVYLLLLFLIARKWETSICLYKSFQGVSRKYRAPNITIHGCLSGFLNLHFIYIGTKARGVHAETLYGFFRQNYRSAHEMSVLAFLGSSVHFRVIHLFHCPFRQIINCYIALNNPVKKKRKTLKFKLRTALKLISAVKNTYNTYSEVPSNYLRSSLIRNEILIPSPNT